MTWEKAACLEFNKTRRRLSQEHFLKSKTEILCYVHSHKNTRAHTHEPRQRDISVGLLLAVDQTHSVPGASLHMTLCILPGSCTRSMIREEWPRGAQVDKI